MFIQLTNTHGEDILVNSDHIVWIEPIGGDRPYRKLHLSSGELAVRQTAEEIVALCQVAVIGIEPAEIVIGPSEIKADVSFVQDVADNPAQVVADALQAERRGGRGRK